MDEQQKKEVAYDADGYDQVTAAVMALVNQFPGLDEGEGIAFAGMGERGGIALYPAVNAAAIESEKTSVTGKVRQICRYPFVVVRKVAGPTEARRKAVKEQLDALGRWLERQPVKIGGETQRLAEYPSITEGRRFLSFVWQTPAGLDDASDDHLEGWAVDVIARYENIFYK